MVADGVPFGNHPPIIIETADNVLGKNGDGSIGAFGVMKLRVEAFEPDVFLGGQKQVFVSGNGPPLVVMELDTAMLLASRPHTDDPARIFKLFVEAGYLITTDGFMPSAPGLDEWGSREPTFRTFGTSVFLDPARLDQWAAEATFADHLYLIHKDFLREVQDVYF
ncbi:hypothetical protein HDU88_002338 [Geranomyces variabilis]|nr:hypothetical protein HDU88_002338 [Geranomyces variabilis]